MKPMDRLIKEMVECRLEIVEKWMCHLSEKEMLVFYQPGGDVKSLLFHLLDDLVVHLQEECDILVFQEEPRVISMATARKMVPLILVGEEVVVEVLGVRLKTTVDEWLLMRKRLNRGFHDLLCAYAGDACDQCRSLLSEQLSMVQGME